MTQPNWNMSDDNGDVMTREAAEERMCQVISDPQLAARYLDELARVDTGLLAVVLVVNPELRERLWDRLDDMAKCYVLWYGGPIRNRERLIRRVVHDVGALYHDPIEGVVT